ncbi:MAG: hypothetical protein ACT6RN_27925, partial [Agrobacterium sp.]|uniref:hypothetical protein n=1 Tax=Agrobacterium sp. TaxID=361 RepID=UPI0040378003
MPPFCHNMSVWDVDMACGFETKSDVFPFKFKLVLILNIIAKKIMWVTPNLWAGGPHPNFGGGAPLPLAEAGSMAALLPAI